MDDRSEAQAGDAGLAGKGGLRRVLLEVGPGLGVASLTISLVLFVVLTAEFVLIGFKVKPFLNPYFVGVLFLVAPLIALFSTGLGVCALCLSRQKKLFPILGTALVPCYWRLGRL